MRYTWGYILNPFESWSGCRMQQPASKAGYRALSALHQCFLICTKCLWNLRHWLQPLKAGTCLFEILNWDLPGPLSQLYDSWEPPRKMNQSLGGGTCSSWQLFYLWDIILLELKYVHALTLREFYENHPVIHQMYLSYYSQNSGSRSYLPFVWVLLPLFCLGIFKVLTGISLA